MLVYYIAYALMLVTVLQRGSWSGIDRQRKNRNYCIFFSILWIGILGLRHPSMGVDLAYGDANGYLGRFTYIANTSWQKLWEYGVANYEHGYIAFCKILSYLGTDHQLLLFTCAAVSIGPVVWWIYRNSDYPFMSTIILLGLPSFMMIYSGLRQALAIAITTVSMEFVKRRKPVHFVLLVLLANTIHSSAWSFLFAYPLYYMRMDKKMGLVSVLIPLVTWVLRTPLFLILSRLFKENAVPDNNGAMTLFLVYLLVYVFAVLFASEDDKEECGMRNVFLMACVCQAMAGVYSTVIRVGYYYMAAMLVLLPRIIRNQTNEESSGGRYGYRKYHNATMMYLVICLCFAAFGLYSISRGSWAMSNPHRFFWQ